MSHAIWAVVGRTADIERAARTLAAPVVDLTDAHAIIPLTHGLRDATSGPLLPPFSFVTESLVARCRELLPAFGVLETEYFGGHGYQRAGAWALATTLVVPHEAPGAVNAVLRALGVVATDGRDEWDTVGLVRFRGMDALLEAARK